MSERICAIVVTYNRQALLRECLLALKQQTRPVDAIWVVDNLSTDLTLEMLREEFPETQVLALKQNVGGAGGFHEGMKQAHENGFDWLWLMDDDGRPAPDCLEILLHRRPQGAQGEVPSAVMVPLQQDDEGNFYGFNVWRGWEVDVLPDVRANRRTSGAPVFRFVGPLISRVVVDKIGLPEHDFFIWFDDIEYALRANRKGVRVVFVAQALFFHNFGGQSREVSFLGRRSVRSYQPAWKIYYGARNHLYSLLKNKRNSRALARDLLWYAKVHARHLVGELMYEPDRWERAKMRLRGAWDGARGRLGKL